MRLATDGRAAPRLTASLVELSRDPYPFTRALRERGPIGWVDALQMWWVVGYREVEAVLRDTDSFVTGTDRSLLYDIFGEHMLTLEGAEAARQKAPFRPALAPAAVRATIEAKITALVDGLIDGFCQGSCVDLRPAFASRLPILVILDLFGLPRSEESRFRGMYDQFEAALSNFEWDERIRGSAKSDVTKFHELLQDYIDAARHGSATSLLAHVVQDGSGAALTDEEVRRNAAIIFFGGISTVEALILNSVHVLGTDASVRERVANDCNLIPSLIEETMRWASPVQSATRHVVRPVTLGGVALEPGDTVNCMLGAANRDPTVFSDPDHFDLDRPNARRHLGFALGDHFCLGSHLARLEVRIATTRLLARLPGFAIPAGKLVQMSGYEFRQPATLPLCWPSQPA